MELRLGLDEPVDASASEVAPLRVVRGVILYT